MSMVLTEREKVLIQMAKQEAITELTTRKKSEHLWSKSKAKLKEKVGQTILSDRTYYTTEAIATLARIIFQRTNVTQFTERDVEMIDEIFEDILSVAIKFRNKKQLI